MQGLYLLWWVEEKQMSPALVATVLAAGDLAVMAFELPTGWFADRFGHRASLILGSAVQVAGMLWCWLGDGVSGLITASVLVALGDGFRSGADQALLYRTCLALDREGDFQRIEARSEAVAHGTLVLQILIGGAIVHQGSFAMGWIAESVLCFVGLLIAAAMVEPPPQSARDHAGSPEYVNRAVHYVDLATVIFPAAIAAGAASVASFLAQTTGSVTVGGATMLVAAATAAEAGGYAIASRLPHISPRGQVLFAAVGSVLLVPAMISAALLPVITLALSFVAGMADPLRAAAIQRLATDHIRARAASAANACDMAISTIVLPLAGAWRSKRR